MARLIKEFEFNPNTNITSQFCSFIPMEKISDTEGVVVSSKETLFKDDAAGYTRFAENDLLWARITPCMQNGKSAVATNLVNGFGYGSTEYFVFRESNGNNIHYLHALLRTKYVRNAAIFYFGGATGHQRVSLDFFNSMTIPLPPLEKQNEISTHIIDIRAQAKQLQQEASQILAEAKTEIERMILGEDA
jgi:type I restriction enzyme S subunit